MSETNSGGTSVPTLSRSYTDDYAGWIEDTASAIEEGRFSEIRSRRSGGSRTPMPPRLKAPDETGLDEEKFPESCQWTVAKILLDTSA